MENEYELSFSAEQINVNLGNAEKAILYTPQNLSEEKKEQGRDNIDACAKPVVIDLTTYGSETEKVSDVLQGLIVAGGGAKENVEMGSLFTDLNTERLIRIKLPFANFTMSMDGVCVVREPSAGVAQLCFSFMVIYNYTYNVHVAILPEGKVMAHVSEI